MNPIFAKAPVRVDIAGSTLDIPPLNLMLGANKEIFCINMAIDIYVCVKIKSRSDKKISINSIDQKKSETLSSLDAKDFDHKNSLSIHKIVLNNFLKTRKIGLDITSCSYAPKGAGLGGSSALVIALIKGVSRFLGINLDKADILNYAKDLEAILLKVPTGLQDYLASLHGSINSFVFAPGKIERVSLKKHEQFVVEKMILFYSGSSRNSGINNWLLFKKIIDKDKSTVSKIEKIIASSEIVLDAILSENVSKFEEGINKEWLARRSLSKNISTESIDKAIMIGFKNGAKAARISGAGGGGCFFLVADKSRHDLIIKELESRFKMKHIPFKISRAGVSITQSID